MESFKQYYNKRKNEDINFQELCLLFESKTLKSIPGTENSYREDPGNTNTKTVKHSHVYAKPNGKGKELYAVGVNGKGHDGSSGVKIPQKHASFFADKGYDIPEDRVLECIDLGQVCPCNYSLILIMESTVEESPEEDLLNE